MLLEFKLRNFRSFLGEQSFIYPGVHRRSASARVAVLFGPNGSGKTNLILALATLRDLVLHSATNTDAQYAACYTPFQLDDADHSATEFEIEVQLEQARYRYTVLYDANRITFERLLVYRTGKPQRWFERQYDPVEQTDKWAPFSPNFNGTRELWRRMTRPRALFLTTAARLECEQLQPLFNWFDSGINIWLGTGAPDLAGIAASIGDVTLKERMLKVLQSVDIPVRDIRVIDATSPGDRPHIEMLYNKIGERPIWLDSSNEGHGTLRLLSVLGPLLPAMAQGRLLVLDEFEAGLHPLVARYLLHLAKSSPKAGAGAQLLVTSHDATLMIPEVLEHQEIWLMERGRDGASRMGPISQRGPRKRERLGRGYLRGRYGGIPQIQL